MKKILVTGATGFIGNYVISRLLEEENCTVIASSRAMVDSAAPAWLPFVQYVPFDITTFDNAIDYFEFFGKPDLLIHLAWQGLPNYKASFHIEQNLPLHQSFLTNCLQNGLKDLSVTGTCF